jgi:hypothetical protein
VSITGRQKAQTLLITFEILTLRYRKGFSIAAARSRAYGPLLLLQLGRQRAKLYNQRLFPSFMSYLIDYQHVS